MTPRGAVVVHESSPVEVPSAAAPPRWKPLTLDLRLTRDPLRMFLFSLTVLTVSRVHQHYPIVAKLRPALLLVILAAGYAFLQPRTLSQKNIFRYGIVLSVVALAFCALGSMVAGISMGNSGRFILEDYSKTLVYAFLLFLTMRNAVDLYRFVWAYVISTGILVFFAQFVFDLSTSSTNYAARLSNLYTYDANDLGVVLLPGLALTMLVLQISGPWVKIVLVTVMVGVGSTIARSGSRGAFIGFVVFGAATLFLVNSISVVKRTIILLLTILSLVLTAPPGYWKQMGTILTPNSDYNATSVDGRKALIQRGLYYLELYPVFGLGINNFTKAECSISPKALAQGGQPGYLRCTPPHNSFVQAAAETGTLGFIAYCSMVFGGMYTMIRVRRRMPQEWRFGDREARFLYHAPTYILLALIGFAVTSAFLTFAWMDPIYILAAFIVGLHVSVEHRVRREGRPMIDAKPRIPPREARRRPWRSFRFG